MPLPHPQKESQRQMKLFNAFVKGTAWPVQWLCFRTKVYYADKKSQSRKIKGPAIIISNHTSVYDYAVFLFVFWRRMLHYQMAECLFRKKLLGRFLRAMGGIYVDRDARDFSFVHKSLGILAKGGVVGIFPESRLPLEGEERPLPFRTSAAYIALESGAPVIPVYTDGNYFGRGRARVIIGKSISVREMWNDSLGYKANLENISAGLRHAVIALKDELDRQREEERRRKEKKKTHVGT